MARLARSVSLVFNGPPAVPPLLRSEDTATYDEVYSKLRTVIKEQTMIAAAPDQAPDRVRDSPVLLLPFIWCPLYRRGGIR